MPVLNNENIIKITDLKFQYSRLEMAPGASSATTTSNQKQKHVPNFDRGQILNFDQQRFKGRVCSAV